jgi:hypothetical protein
LHRQRSPVKKNTGPLDENPIQNHPHLASVTSFSRMFSSNF